MGGYDASQLFARLLPRFIPDGLIRMPPRIFADRNTRLGLRYFFVYTAVYLAFVLVIAFAPQWSEWELIEGLNMAVAWGFGLIVFAFLLAMMYGLGCQPDDSDPGPAPRDAEESK